MKKSLCLLLITALLLTVFAGCGEQQMSTTTTVDTTTAAQTDTTTQEQATTTAAEVTTTVAATTGATTTKATTTVATTTKATTAATTAPTTAIPETKDYVRPLTISDSFNEDGSLNFDMLANDILSLAGWETYYSHSTDEFHNVYVIPEADALTALRRVYVISDDYFSRLKAQGTYDMSGPETLEYKNGQFLYTSCDGWGGGNFPTFKPLSYTDDNKGTLKFYFDYGIFEMGSGEVVHQQYLEVTYTYTDHAPFEVDNSDPDIPSGSIVSKSEAFIKSLKVTAITPVASPAGTVTIA